MGSVPVRLHDDRPRKGLGPPCWSRPAVAPDTGPCLDDVWRLRRRVTTGYDPDGNAMFDWSTVLEAPGVVETRRQETDPDHGATVEKATVKLWTIEPVDETGSMFRLRDSSVWRITGSTPGPGVVTLQLDRVDV